jgi:hypothetical protein
MVTHRLPLVKEHVMLNQKFGHRRLFYEITIHIRHSLASIISINHQFPKSINLIAKAHQFEYRCMYPISDFTNPTGLKRLSISPIENRNLASETR